MVKDGIIEALDEDEDKKEDNVEMKNMKDDDIEQLDKDEKPQGDDENQTTPVEPANKKAAIEATAN